MTYAREILGFCSFVSVEDIDFKNEVPIIRPSEAIEAIEQAQKQAWNEAIRAAVESAEVKHQRLGSGATFGVVNKQSILKLLQ